MYRNTFTFKLNSQSMRSVIVYLNYTRYDQMGIIVSALDVDPVSNPIGKLYFFYNTYMYYILETLISPKYL